MNEYRFPEHARDSMRRDAISVEGVYHVIEDADRTLDYDDGRTEYVGEWEGRTFSVILERDGLTIVTVMEIEKRRRRRDRRRR